MWLSVETQTLRLAEPFRISGYLFETADVLAVTLADGRHRGRGEAAGVAVTVAVAGGVAEDVLAGWPAVMIGYPAAVSVPLAFATMIIVSRLTRADVPSDVAQTFARMHVPENLGMGIERMPRGQS